MAAHRLYYGFMGTPLLITAVVWAVPAKADTTAYLNDLHTAGITAETGDSGMLQTGRQVCDLIASGVPSAEIKARILYNSDTNEGAGGVDPAQANDIVNYAMLDLCPSA